jgi:hypothetical protein
MSRFHQFLGVRKPRSYSRCYCTEYEGLNSTMIALTDLLLDRRRREKNVSPRNSAPLDMAALNSNPPPILAV